ncbi:MAG: flavin reductase [Oscillospiraceae bacterium]|nr:flavin reductase [Oscillospiraceae bacterium]
MAFEKINPEQWNANPFHAIGKQWMLLTSGDTTEGWNTMTASWGAVGVMWNKPSLTCYVRHSRHTFGYMEKNDLFSVSFFGNEYRDALNFCGSHSGRDCDKAAETGLHPMELDGTTAFEEAETILICKKKYAAEIDADELPVEIVDSFYSSHDAHRMYIAEIVACYVKK